MTSKLFSFKRGRELLVYVIPIGIGVALLVIFLICNSEFYETAQRFAFSSEKLNAKCGKVQSASMAPYDIHVSTTSSFGIATFHMNISCSSSSGVMSLELKHEGKEWYVNKAIYEDHSTGEKTDLKQ